MNDLLVTINLIESAKWTLFNLASKVPINSSIVPATDITAFSNPKHVEVDDVDDNFARGTFPFFLFLVPQTILMLFVLHRVFRCLSQYKVSVYFRRYFFLLACVVQILVEDNISFFSYLFFQQTFVAFSFKFTDKLFIAASVSMFLLVVLAACCFYFLCNEIYGKCFGYFIYCFYRIFPAFVFLTVRHFGRGLLRGAIHSCLHFHYRTEIIMLCGVEALVIVLAVWLEKKK